MKIPSTRILLAGVACLFFQASPAWLLAARSGDHVMTAQVAASLEGPLGLPGRQLLSATSPPLVAFVLSTSALCPFLLLLLWEMLASPWANLPRASRAVRVQISWAVLQALGLSVLFLVLSLRAPGAQDIGGWSLRIAFWSVGASIAWIACLSILAHLVRRVWLRVLAWLALVFCLLLMDTLWRTQPAPLLPPIITRDLLAGARGWAVCASLLWIALAAAVSNRARSAASIPAEPAVD